MFASCTTSEPITLARPAVGVSSVVNILTVVVFPAPFGPSSPKSSPWETPKLIPSNANTSFTLRRKTPIFARYVRFKFCTSIMFVLDLYDFSLY